MHTTGHQPTDFLLQDLCRGLFDWFASKPGAWSQARAAADAIAAARLG